MKKLLLVAGIISLGFTSSFAQDLNATARPAPTTVAQAPASMSRKMDPKAMAGMQANRLKRELELTDEQTGKVKTVLEAANMQPSANKMNNPETEKQIKEILTPDQVKKFDDLKAKREAYQKQRAEQQQQASFPKQ